LTKKNKSKRSKGGVTAYCVVYAAVSYDGSKNTRSFLKNNKKMKESGLPA
jgi:hypothetical protein